MVQFVNVEETGSNFPCQVWNPLGFPTEAYADALRKLSLSFFVDLVLTSLIFSFRCTLHLCLFVGDNQQKVADARQLAKSQQQNKRTEIEFEKSSSSSTSNSNKKIRRLQDTGVDSDHNQGHRDRDRGVLQRDRERERDRDRRRGGTRSPQWHK